MAKREGGARWRSREISTGVGGCRSSRHRTAVLSWKRERREEGTWALEMRNDFEAC